MFDMRLSFSIRLYAYELYNYICKNQFQTFILSENY